MKTPLLLIALVILPFFLSGQTDNVVFFQSSEERDGKHYATAMLPLLIDSTQHIERQQTLHYNTQEIRDTIVDTLQLHDFYALSNPADYQHIKEWGDTSSVLLQVEEEKRRLVRPDSCYPYESVTETYRIIPETKEWVRGDAINNDLLDFNSWKLKMKEEQVRQRSVWKVPIPDACGFPIEEVIPGRYKTVIAFVPKHPLRGKAKETVERYCQQTVLAQRIEVTQHSLDVLNAHYYWTWRYKIVQEAGLAEVEVYSDKEMRAKAKAVKIALAASGFHAGEPNKRLDTAFKTALMEYQLANSLPAGQFDKGTIDCLVGE